MKLEIIPRTFALAALNSLLAMPAFAENGTAEAPFRFYTVLDGMTQSNVVDIAQDQAGYLWFTTARGVNRYDGREFDQFTIADGLPNNSLTALHVSHTNSVWVGDMHGGIAVIHGARVVHTIEPPKGMAKPILDIEIIGERKIAVIEDIGIVEVTTDSDEFVVEHLIGNSATEITDLAVVDDDIWVQSSTGLYKFELDVEPTLELLAESVRIIHTDRAGSLWVADESGRVGIWRDGAFVQRIKIDSENPIVSIVTDHDGLVWIATTDEVFKFSSRTNSSENSSVEIQKYSGIDDVTSMFVDRENSLWLSSGSRLMRFLGDRFQHFRLRTSFDSETVWAVSEDRRGRFWFATESKLLLRNEDESITVVGKEAGIPKGTVRDIVADENGNLWVGITDHGLYRFDVEAMWATHITESHTAGVLDIAIAGDSAIWYSTIEGGVFRYEPATEKLTRFDTPENTSVYSLDVSENGVVWYGADEVGLVQLVPRGDGQFVQKIIGTDLEVGGVADAAMYEAKQKRNAWIGIEGIDWKGSSNDLCRAIKTEPGQLAEDGFIRAIESIEEAAESVG